MKEKVKVDCENCIFYEQKIKDKDQRIAELEEELENSKFETDNYESKYTKLMEAKQKIENKLVKCGKKLRQQQEENTKLQEQLKNALEDLDYAHIMNKSRSRLYNIWHKMNERCFNEKDEAYKNYGGRGITICDEWQRIAGFYSFQIWALNNGYKKGLTIERINNDGNYEPSNCRWATYTEQQNNTRKNRIITVKGETASVGTLAKKYNISKDIVYTRLNLGWSQEDAVLTPVRKKNYKPHTEAEAQQYLEEHK